MGLTPTGKALISIFLALATAATLWPSEWLPAGLQSDAGNGSTTACPLGFTADSNVPLPPMHPPVTKQSRQPPAEPRELVLWRNGAIWTGDSQHKVAEAMLVHPDGYILGVGTAASLEAQAQELLLTGAMQTVSKSSRDSRMRLVLKTLPQGSFLMPGFVDAHVHFLQAGLFLSNVNLRGAPSIEEVQSRVAAYVAVLQQQEERQKEWLLAQGHALVAGEMPLLWVTGGQWMEGSWGGALPHKSWLDAVTGPYRPALLSRMDSHAAIANSAALALAGITSATPNPPGGIIDKDESGQPTGILRENAVGMVARLIPPPTQTQLRTALQAASSYALARGVTSMACLGRAPFSGSFNTTWTDLEEVFLPAADAGELRVRLFAFVPLPTWQKLPAFIEAHGRAHPGGRLFAGGVKEFADGSIGAHTALMWEPYHNKLQNHSGNSSSSYADGAGKEGGEQEHGTRMLPLSKLREMVQGADAAGLHVAVHAIGDRAVDEVVQVYAEVQAANAELHNAHAASSQNTNRTAECERSGRVDCIHVVQPHEVAVGCPKHRIEHAQHLSGPKVMEEIARLGIITTPNPPHLPDDGPVMLERLGPERAGPGRSYAFRSMAAAGVKMGLSSDWPVVDLHPLASVFTSIHRSDPLVPGSPAHYPDQEGLTPEQALMGHTVAGAEAAMLGGYVGALKPGMRADFIILSSSPLDMAPGKDLPQVLQTYVDGQLMYERQAAAAA